MILWLLTWYDETLNCEIDLNCLIYLTGHCCWGKHSEAVTSTRGRKRKLLQNISFLKMIVNIIWNCIFWKVEGRDEGADEGAAEGEDEGGDEGEGQFSKPQNEWNRSEKVKVKVLPYSQFLFKSDFQDLKKRVFTLSYSFIFCGLLYTIFTHMKGKGWMELL